jgi:hypothetical protein
MPLDRRPTTSVEARVADTPSGFKPYVADEAALPELTLRAVLLGSFLGLIFGASSVYLACASAHSSRLVPIAVFSISLFRALKPRGKPRRRTASSNRRLGGADRRRRCLHAPALVLPASAGLAEDPTLSPSGGIRRPDMILCADTSS